jgi:hypothetical protein
MKEVIVTLNGGLGNQMFQLAAGRALALREKANLSADITPLLRHGQRTYGLGDFQLGTNVRLQAEATSRRFSRLRRLARQIFMGEQLFKEASFAYDDRILQAHAPVRIDGYFQSERYFSGVAAEIRADFMPRAEKQAGVDELAARLLPGQPSVSLHVRRGDYTDPAVMKVHGLIGADYYERALQLIAEKAGTCVVCVFTDDPAWVRANLSLPEDARFVSEHTKSAMEDLMLMSRCSHHITANSSFSWWGAWLNPSEQKVIVSPARWFQPDSGIDARDLRPQGWLQA